MSVQVSEVVDLGRAPLKLVFVVLVALLAPAATVLNAHAAYGVLV